MERFSFSIFRNKILVISMWTVLVSPSMIKLWNLCLQTSSAPPSSYSFRFISGKFEHNVLAVRHEQEYIFTQVFFDR
jgi:hypothetical protein